MVTIILTSVMDSIDSKVECSSSEEMQRAMLDANQVLKEEKVQDPVVFSMDVKALYPSLDLGDMLEAVTVLVEGSRLEYKDINCKELSTYLAIMVAKEELSERGLLEHIPRRTVEMEGRQRTVPAYLDFTWYCPSIPGLHLVLVDHPRAGQGEEGEVELGRMD